MCTVSVSSPDTSYYENWPGAKFNFESMFQQERNLNAPQLRSDIMIQNDSCFRGRPFDSEEGGGLANFVGTYYLFSAGARSENLFSGIPRPDYLFSSATKFWKSKIKKKQPPNKKKRHQKTPRERGGGVQNIGSEGSRTRTGFSMGFFFIFCTLPGSVCGCAYIL